MISKYPNVRTFKHKKGFALLIAVVLAAIILTIGLSIISTALKEVILASTVRSSVGSFYAADGGAECALYWDDIRGNFQKHSAFVTGTNQSRIECQSVVIDPVGNGPTVNFWLRHDDALSRPCANINIVAEAEGPNVDKVALDSWGFNSCDLANTRRVDRALEVKYSRYH